MKRIICFVILVGGIASAVPAADQFFFELTGGVYFYVGYGGRVGWMHYWENEKVGFICDVSYYNNGFVDEFEGDWKEAIKKAHNIGLAAGVVFNNMGMDGAVRTSQYIKLKGFYTMWDNPAFLPCIDAGYKVSIFFTDAAALSAGIGIEVIPLASFYLSLGMIFTL